MRFRLRHVPGVAAIALVIAGLTLAVVLVLGRRAESGAVVIRCGAVEPRAAIHTSPYGHFAISNGGHREILWRAEIEEPANRDADFAFSVVLNSHIPMGTLASGATTDFTTLVPSIKGVAYRVVRAGLTISSGFRPAEFGHNQGPDRVV